MDEKTSLRKQPAEQSAAPPAARAVDEADVRASDADRDRIAEILREALAEGRLDTEEHAERVGAAYRAKTIGELRPLVRDLPAARTGVFRPSPAPAPESRGPFPGTAQPGPPCGTSSGRHLLAIFGGASRKGRWRVGPRTSAFALFGGIEIDLTEALFDHREVVIDATAVFGGIEIRVPENITLRGSGTGIMGGYDVRSAEAEDPDAPVVVVRGAAVFGGVEARPKRGKRLRDLRR
ncbi:DUF1707 domain-containing protein [Streptomyces sp. TRM 70361]|uniref:DUF1707 SHOCT-like domain-containing protein n=1 Tax=Streptomyces sp. TRM 70361 TaxID=3116553 RepID=UPI002E7B8D62|nr:DUF1707 domain-containing protein [Streptomyces sp. TRM 70361]MEE1939264.1 DUF1707 domain-containing protein [Streptomyces sp. TRM 70361]